MKMTHAELVNQAVPSIHDQSTNAQIWVAKVLRTQDINPFTQLQFLRLGFGLFHLCMNQNARDNTTLCDKRDDQTGPQRVEFIIVVQRVQVLVGQSVVG